MRARLMARLLPALFAALTAGCGAAGDDPDVDREVAPGADAALDGDIGDRPDDGLDPDGGQPPDGGRAPDAGPAPDSGLDPDGGADSGPTPDGDLPVGDPCVDVDPTEVNILGAVVGLPHRAVVSIASCGAGPLHIERVELIDDGGGRFAIDPEALPALPAELPAAPGGEALPSLDVTVVYTGDDEMLTQGRLVIETDDPDAPVTEISLRALAAVNACPVPVVEADRQRVEPLGVVVLDATPSRDVDGPDGRPVRYEWTVITRPDGSVAQPVEAYNDPDAPADGGPADDPETPTALFFADIAGDYFIELRVVDVYGLASPGDTCAPRGLAHIIARPSDGVYVELTWETPGDLDPRDDSGADVDLWLMHPLANGWAPGHLRCDYGNPHPDWGVRDDPADDPEFVIDDVNGLGPELLDLVEPEDSLFPGDGYRIGVAYYTSVDPVFGDPFGPSQARVRVYFDGDLAFDDERELQRSGNLWHPGTIEWGPRAADRRVVPVDAFWDVAPQ